MEFVNLTPHAITVDIQGERTTFPPSGEVARLATTKEEGTLGGFPVSKTVFGEVSGVPAAKVGTIFIVSTLVAQALKRNDVVSPDTGPTAVRENGQVIAVKGFQRF